MKNLGTNTILTPSGELSVDPLVVRMPSVIQNAKIICGIRTNFLDQLQFQTLSNSGKQELESNLTKAELAEAV